MAVAPKTVLVVDDEPDVAGMVRTLLELEGYQVDTADDGSQALRAVAGHMPDLILLDMKMPVVDGPTFAREFRERYGYRVPVIAFTASANCDGCADEVWANGWLGKPFNVDDLMKIVRRHVY